MLPSFFVPAEFTEPVLKEPAYPVAVMVTVVCADTLKHNASAENTCNSFFFILLSFSKSTKVYIKKTITLHSTKKILIVVNKSYNLTI